MNKNIEEINKIRELQLSKRKQVEENNKKLQLENEERNKVLKEVDEIKNKWIEAVKKYDINLSEEENRKKMPTKEIGLCNADYLELPIRVDEKYFKYIEEGYGLYPYNKIIRNYDCIVENTKLFFTKEERNNFYINCIDKNTNGYGSKKIEKSTKYTNKNIKEDEKDEANKTEDNKIDIEPLIRFIVDGKDFSKEECNKIVNKITVLCR